ncbi:MAG TPA: chemotaxis protein CheD [Tenuifilaceae bacterium]|nr:chemotaxis protein CheD [Tenuifilaceae bacterium]HRX31000.1 chemotaxis protein CheD [Tenuifilaceae bacterium]
MSEVQSYYLYPSALFAEKEAHLVSTILGSCVAVCLYDPVLNIGGINHFMLPLWNGQGLASPRYGNIAIERLIERMLLLGSKKGNLKGKVFGGAEVIETKVANFYIGERNIKVAVDMLLEQNIPIVAKSVGGKLGRKILFNTQTGEVKQKYIEKQNL